VYKRQGLGVEQFIDPMKMIFDGNAPFHKGMPAFAHKAFHTALIKEAIEQICSYFNFPIKTIPCNDLPEFLRHYIIFGKEYINVYLQIRKILKKGEDANYLQTQFYFEEGFTDAGYGYVKNTTKTQQEFLHFIEHNEVLAQPYNGIVAKIEESIKNSNLYLWWGAAKVEEFVKNMSSERACVTCGGSRLKEQARCVTVAEKHLHEINQLSLENAFHFFDTLKISPQKQKIAEKIIFEIKERLNFLNSVGLNYLSLGRTASTLSGGEAQRIRLASQIGSGLTGVMYVLDEPSIGLHQCDNDRLIATLKRLRDLGNTVLVVEHDEDAILNADWVIDIGPRAGVHGGNVVFQGTPHELLENANQFVKSNKKSNKKSEHEHDATISLTGLYLNKHKKVNHRKLGDIRPYIFDENKSKEQTKEVKIVKEVKETKEDKPKLSKIKLSESEAVKKSTKNLKKTDELIITGARTNNLKNVDIKIPVGLFTCFTGVSGSGKSSFMNHTLAPVMRKFLNREEVNALGKYDTISGLEHFDKMININQSAIGRTPRSNPATYVGLLTPIRELFAETNTAKERGYKVGRFSFNVQGGRCEACQGDGMIRVEMHFLPDVYVTCEHCQGKRYNRETLEVYFKGKNISDVLEMTVSEATEFFKSIPTIHRKVSTLEQVGLGYIRLGQSAITLSGGEAQRVKLALELAKRDTGKTLYLFDEPTTGLHFDDIAKLLDIVQTLCDKGNTIVMIEHNLDVVASADWVIDMGPKGGDEGGLVVATGTPMEICHNEKSVTGRYLKKLF
jgi:excinuclease ABC subunit A